jgi:5'-3' exonuclease
MGIAGLLSGINDVAVDAHISDYAGLTAGVDVFGWLHRGISTHFELVAENDRPAAERPVAYVLEMCELLERHNVTPFLIFDGGHLPAKAATDAARRAERAKSLERARALLAVDPTDAAGAALLRKSASVVTDDMVHLLQRALRDRGTRFLVAPFEADAQLAYLARGGLVDVVVSEDSDMLCFGTPLLFTKMEKGGGGKQLRLRALGAAAELCFLNWSHAAFVECCVLSGCDYLPSLRGVGLKTAHKLLRAHKSAEALFEAARREAVAAAAAAAAAAPAPAPAPAAAAAARGSGSVVASGLGPAARAGLDANYEAGFWRARALFQYHRVWDPEAEALVTLNPLPPLAELRLGTAKLDDFLGVAPSAALMKLVAAGELHPDKLESYEDLAKLRGEG